MVGSAHQRGGEHITRRGNQAASSGRVLGLWGELPWVEPAIHRVDVDPADRLADSLPVTRYLPARSRRPRWIGPLVETLAFWGAIVLPIAYLSLLFAGIDDASGLLLFLGLFALHVLALVAGRSHRAGRRR